MAIFDQEYVSSGSQNGERHLTKNGKEESSPNGEQGLPSNEEQGSSSYGELGGNAARPRPLREFRKTPFSLSPPPNSRSHFSFPRQYKFDESYVELDEDFDAILERQRVADQSSSTEDKPGPKRKREILSDQDHRLRKERTDDLVEGFRNVRENVRLEGLRNDRGRDFASSRRPSPDVQLQREAEKKRELFGRAQPRDHEDRCEHDVRLADMRRAIVQRMTNQSDEYESDRWRFFSP